MPGEVRRLRRDEAELLRALRLRALTESPRAFGAALEDEAELPPSEWHARARAGAAGEQQVVFVALDDEQPVGMAGGRWFERAESTIALWGMWVDPTARGTGVATTLVAAVRDWASAAGAQRLRLGVVADGAAAIRFYERLGFRREGEMQRLRRDPDQLYFEMYRAV
ncbi:MAG TPA: GNAT family N-acetyltransferase [Solirubrobacteraceae bacterium]|nr:GNAT family N-acetyltransferase [Solirubrobacteraceae bacterium]